MLQTEGGGFLAAFFSWKVVFEVSVFTMLLPALPFGSYSDCVLLYAPYSGIYRVIVFDSDGSNYLQCATDYLGKSIYATQGCNIRLPYGACAEYQLVNGEWIQRTHNVWMANNNIFASEKDCRLALGQASYPISSTFDLVLKTAGTPYESFGSEITLNLAHSETTRQPVTIVDSVLSAERVSTPIFMELFGLLPVLIPVLVGCIAIRKGISFLSFRLRGA